MLFTEPASFSLFHRSFSYHSNTIKIMYNSRSDNHSPTYSTSQYVQPFYSTIHPSNHSTVPTILLTILLYFLTPTILQYYPYNAHTSPILKKLGILLYNLLIKQANLNLMHSIEYNYHASNSLMEQFPKNQSRTQTICYATQMTSLYLLLELKLKKNPPVFSPSKAME